MTSLNLAPFAALPRKDDARPLRARSPACRRECTQGSQKITDIKRVAVIRCDSLTFFWRDRLVAFLIQSCFITSVDLLELGEAIKCRFAF
jgi:hypothetical protein